MTGVQTCALPIYLDVGDVDLFAECVALEGGGVQDGVDLLPASRVEIGRASCRERV